MQGITLFFHGLTLKIERKRGELVHVSYSTFSRCISIDTIGEIVDLMVHPQASITGLIIFQSLQKWEVVDLMVHPHASIVGLIHNHQFNLKKETLK